MGRISWPTVILCFLVCGVAASAAPQAEQKREELPHPKTLEELQKAMHEVVEKNHVTDRADYPLLDVFQRFEEPENVRWPPGTRFAYSNPGYGIAGYLIEKITGQPFDAYIRQSILAPLEITVGDFRLTDANRAALAEGYEGHPPTCVLPAI